MVLGMALFCTISNNRRAESNHRLLPQHPFAYLNRVTTTVGIILLRLPSVKSMLALHMPVMVHIPGMMRKDQEVVIDSLV
jgi:hypothetical protein